MEMGSINEGLSPQPLIKQLLVVNLYIKRIHMDSLTFEPTLDSRILSEHLGFRTHSDLMRNLIMKHRAQVEQAFGLLNLANNLVHLSGGVVNRSERYYALLTEKQCQFFLTRTRRRLTGWSIDLFKEMGFDFSMFESKTQGFPKESYYSNLLARELGGVREVRTPAGNIDVLTPEQIIEVKALKYWKAALGQVLVYGHYYPTYQKRIHLYGDVREPILKMIETHCELNRVVVTTEQITSDGSTDHMKRLGGLALAFYPL